MPIPVSCVCGRSFRVKDHLAGKRARCPDCGGPVAVPDGPTARRDQPAIPPPPPRAPVPILGLEEEREREETRARYRRSRPQVMFEKGWYRSIDIGVLGGLLMILAGSAWFLVRRQKGYIDFRPIGLITLGTAAAAKGIMGR